MPPTSRLYDALSQFLSQCEIQSRDARHLKTLCWMMLSMIHGQNVHLNGFGMYGVSILKDLYSMAFKVLQVFHQLSNR
ncbi:hypothetical protein DO97_09675 [Neosynechococcus sphagnicola sy1]|uniref:Uncharacterized protein n=1 Tax=Neosynechococcus sphagnicola sy1 TaxID=1497020 RepID=A0A098TNC8_9CYAN|nr:hypothetical protein [Neosynechococcus sphagnicola]KGF72348.1 hypothetical protein DO97_09675 [Neosynechococcus sphagnicola sy1]